MDFRIEGMHCGSCAARVENALQALPGGGAVTVNFATKKARIPGNIDRKAVTQAVESIGYQAIPIEDAVGEVKKSDDFAKRRRDLVIAFMLSSPVVVLGMLHRDFAANGLIQLTLTTALLVGPARGFFVRAAALARRRGVNMDTLVALGVGAAFAYSVTALLQGRFDFYFESAAAIAALVLAGQYLEERARHSAQDAVDQLRKLETRRARKRLADGSESDVDAAELRADDYFVVSSGERIAVDGDVIEGESDIDESLITGESLPVSRAVGSQVLGGTTNVGTGRLVVRANKGADESVFGRIVSLVEDAQASKAAAQRLADKVASIFVPIVLLLAGSSWLVWFFGIGASGADALVPAVAVLVIACPCALGLATPTAILVGTGRAARAMILIRSAPGLEQTGRITTLVVDKTGTLTDGRPSVSEVKTAPNVDESHLALVGAAAQASRHPLSKAVALHVEREVARTSRPPRVAAFEERHGLGFEATVIVSGRAAKVIGGSRKLLASSHISIPETWHSSSTGGEVLVAIDGVAAYHFQVVDPVHSTSKAAVQKLASLGVKIVMATGDREEVARKVATEVGIQDVRFGLMPDQKLDLIAALRAAGEVVGMVGDGVNDAPALVAADVGIAVGSGADVAIDAAHVVIPHGNLVKIAEVIHISKRTSRTIKQNLWWAFLYNVLAIPVAAAGALSPMIAAGAMALSSLSVVGNSLRLRRVRSVLEG